MNERIGELAEKCGFRSNPDLYDRNQSFDIPKFAELIVKECAAIALREDHEPSECILRHFGVER
jgi:hypothetical protein